MIYYSAVFMHPKQANPFNLFLGFKALSTAEKIYTLVTLGGYALAKKHWELANWDHSWCHRIIAVIECCLLLGGLFSIIEALATALINKGESDQFIKDSWFYFKSVGTIISNPGENKDQHLENFANQLAQNNSSDPRVNYVRDLKDIPNPIRPPEADFSAEYRQLENENWWPISEFAKKLEIELWGRGAGAPGYNEIDTLIKQVYEKLKELSNGYKNNKNEEVGREIAMKIPYHRESFWLNKIWGIEDPNLEVK